jgi:hypothetical protein
VAEGLGVLLTLITISSRVAETPAMRERVMTNMQERFQEDPAMVDREIRR